MMYFVDSSPDMEPRLVQNILRTLYPFRVLSLPKRPTAMSTMSPQQQLNRILPKMVKLNVQEEVDEEREITDAPRMLSRKVGGNYGKGFSFNKKRRTRQVAMTRYVGGRQVGKRLPGPLSKS